MSSAANKKNRNIKSGTAKTTPITYPSGNVMKNKRPKPALKQKNIANNEAIIFTKGLIFSKRKSVKLVYFMR